MGKLTLLFVFVSLFSFVSVVFPRQTGFAEEVSFQEMFQTVQRAGEEVRALQFQTQRVLGPMLPPEEIQIASTLRFGMRGEEVRALQGLLRRDREIYPEGLITGYFGALTEDAVRRFQKVQGLNAVGIVDSWTRAYLRGFSRVTPPFFASERVESVDAVSTLSSFENVLEVQGVTPSQVLEIVSTFISTSTSTSTSTVSSGGSGGGGSPTIRSSGSSGGSGGSSPTLSAFSDSDSTVSEVSTSTTLATSTIALEEQSVSTSTPSLSVDSATSTDSQSSTTVSVVSSTVVTSLDDDDDDDDNDDDNDDDADRKAEKKLEKEIKKAEKAEKKAEKGEDKGGTVAEEIKLEIKEVSSEGSFSNLASILSSLSGFLGRVSLFFR